MVDFFNSKELLIDGIGKLKSRKVPNPEIDARILLSYASNYQNTIYMHNDIDSHSNENQSEEAPVEEASSEEEESSEESESSDE